MARSKATKSHKSNSQYDESIDGVEAGAHFLILAGMQRHLEISSTINRLAELVGAEDSVPEAVKNHVKSLQLIIQAALSAHHMQLEEAPELWLKRKNKDETPVDFIRRVYEPWLGHGLSRPDIRKLDRSLYQAFYGWLAKGNELPEGFDLPTKRQANDARFESLGMTGDEITKRLSELKEATHVNRVAKRRIRRLAKTPTPAS